MSPQKMHLKGKEGTTDLVAATETGKDLSLDQLIQSQQPGKEKSADRLTYQSNFDSSSKMLYSKIQIVPGPGKKGQQLQPYLANLSTEKSRERETALVNYSKLAAAEAEGGEPGARQVQLKNQTKVGIKKNLQSLNNTNANLNSSGMLNERKT